MRPEELKARREALGLTQGLLAADLGNKQSTVSQWESGKRTIPADVDARLTDLETQLGHLIESATRALEAAATSGLPGAVLHVWPNDEAFWAAHPDLDGLPAVIHRVAMARAAAETYLPETFTTRLATP